MTYAGIALVVSDQIGTSGEGKLFLLGVLLVFASALCYAVYLVAGSQVVKRVGSMRFTAYSMVVATAPALLQFFALEPRRRARAAGQRLDLRASSSPRSAPCCRCSCRPRRCGASARTSSRWSARVSPVSVAVMSALGLGEPFGPRQMAGAALVIGGVLLVSLKRS